MIAGEIRRRRSDRGAVQASRRILDQHTELRRLLAQGLVQVYASSRDQGCASAAPRALPALVARIRGAFVQHLADEETLLLPLLEAGRLGGPELAQVLRDEHERQRRELDTLSILSETDNTEAFADRFDTLARAFLTDIAKQERELTIATADLDDRFTSSVYIASA